MNRQVIILFFTFLLSVASNAQKTISKETFDQLVDYASCNYVRAFTEKNDIGTTYYKETYEKKIKPELDKVNLGDFKTILSYQKLSELLSKNIPATQLCSKINARKLKYDELQDNESLIKSLSTTGWKSVDLSTIAATIQNDIHAKYDSTKGKKIVGVSESEVVKTQTIETSSQVDELQSKLDTLRKQYEYLKNDTKILDYQNKINKLEFMLYSLFGIIFLFFIGFFWYLFNGNLRNYIIRQVLGSDRISDKFSKGDNLTKYKLSSQDFEEINNRVENLAKKIIREKQQQEQGAKESKIITHQVVSIKYLKGQSGKNFSRVENTPEYSYFRLFNENGDYAQFEFSGDDADAIAKRVFNEDICTISAGSYVDAHTVKTDKPGKIKRVGDNWEVIEKIIIKLI